MRGTTPKTTKRTNGRVDELAQKISALLKDFDEMSPVKKAKVYVQVGHLLDAMTRDVSRYGEDSVAEIVRLVPQLGCRRHVHTLRSIAKSGKQNHRFLAAHLAATMSNGEHPTIDHWGWILLHAPTWTAWERQKWQTRELEWVCREAPPGATLAHVARVLAAKHEEEMATYRMNVQEVVGQLEYYA
jgi:hypothetical protein